MTIDLKVLETLDLFQEVHQQDLEILAAMMRSFRVKEGEILTRRGDPAQHFYIVLSGNFMIHFKSGKAFTLHQKGDVIGMSTMLEPFSYRGTTVALTDGEVLVIAGDQFSELIQGNARLGEKVMRSLNDVIAHRTPFFGENAGLEK